MSIKWTKARTEKFKKTMKAKRAAGWNPVPYKKSSVKAKAVAVSSPTRMAIILLQNSVRAIDAKVKERGVLSLSEQDHYTVLALKKLTNDDS